MTTPTCSPANPNLLSVCDWCAGSGTEPNEESAAVDCLICEGGGFSPVAGELGRTKSYKRRAYVFYPGVGKLVLSRDSKRDDYFVREYAPDYCPEIGPARAFRVAKASNGELYHCLASRAGWSCDCAGCEWQTSHKANARSYVAGGAMHETRGCIHLDALAQILEHGLLDLPRPFVPDPEPEPPAAAVVAECFRRMGCEDPFA